MEDLINAILDYSELIRRASDDVLVNSQELVQETFEFIGQPERETGNCSI